MEHTTVDRNLAPPILVGTAGEDERNDEKTTELVSSFGDNCYGQCRKRHK